MSNLDANWDVEVIAGLYRSFGRRARVIALDRRGFGVSDRPTTPDAMTLEIAMDDLRQVMDAAGSERAVLFGLEAGAGVSLLFAASFPERTLGLVLQAPLVYYWKTADFPWGATEESGREWRRMVESSWGTVEFWRFNAAALNVARPDEAMLRVWAKWSRLCASPQAARAIDAMEEDVDLRGLLPDIRVPTLVLQAEGDEGNGLWGASEWVAQHIPGAQYVVIPNATHVLEAKDVEAFDAIDRFVAGIQEVEAEFDRVLASVLFTDIVGSTDHAASLGDREWRGLLERHHAMVRAMLTRYRGVEVDTTGDGFFATFDGPARAVRCAQAIANAVRPLGLEIRAGVHTGEIQTIDGKAGGLGVVIGARIGGLAGASEVLVSQTVKDLVAGSGLAFEDTGEHQLKGVPDPWHVYRVAA
jgi:pimeloyl-ACP methyl ester carboxylesterase